MNEQRELFAFPPYNLSQECGMRNVQAEGTSAQLCQCTALLPYYAQLCSHSGHAVCAAWSETNDWLSRTECIPRLSSAKRARHQSLDFSFQAPSQWKMDGVEGKEAFHSRYSVTRTNWAGATPPFRRNWSVCKLCSIRTTIIIISAPITYTI